VLLGSDTADIGLEFEEQHTRRFDEDQVREAGHVAATVVVVKHEPAVHLGGVGQPGQGLAIDYQVVAEIRAFEVDTSGADVANVEIFVKILNDRNGTVRAQRAFRATVPVSGTENRDFVAALNNAFAAVGAEIVDWSLQSM